MFSWGIFVPVHTLGWILWARHHNINHVWKFSAFVVLSYCFRGSGDELLGRLTRGVVFSPTRTAEDQPNERLVC